MKKNTKSIDVQSSHNNEHVQVSELDQLVHQFLKIEQRLNANIPTTLWISDLHGEGDRFKSILRGRFGMLYQTCTEALPKTFSVHKIQHLVRIIRKRKYIKDDKIKMDIQDVIMCLVQVLKYRLTNIGYNVEAAFRPEFHETINRLLAGLPVPDPIFEEEIISTRLISHLSFTISRVLLDRIQVLGDSFDRGAQPDKILRILSSAAYRNMVDYVFGNHDILWMGAAAGNKSLVAEAMRISVRYDHFVLLSRLGFDTTMLTEFGEKTYPVDLVKGNFKAKTDKGLSTEKALTVIQFKLEEQTIREFPEYKMDSRLWMDRLAEILQTKKCGVLNDSHFPTIDYENPAKLSLEEEAVVEDLTNQFTTNSKLKRLLAYLFEKGQTYHVHNNALNIHALVPTTEDGHFEEFLGRKGKNLLDFVQSTIVRAGERYINGEDQAAEDKALFFYLWCGPKSPFFGKHAMKTFERYFLLDEGAHEEKTLYWKKNLKSEKFKEKLQQEFGVSRVIYGHTPVDYLKGARMASDDGVAINVDGGFAAAYYNRGHSLVHTPHQLYGIILPTPDEMLEAERTLESAPLDVELIDEFRQPMKIKDTVEGKDLMKQRDILLSKIKNFSKSEFV